MAELISRNILDDEILVRYLFFGHFKRKKPAIYDNIMFGNIYIDTRDRGVSLLRYRYNDENECLKRGLETMQDLAGFYIFKKCDFLDSIKAHIEDNNEGFEAIIVSSPLDENEKVISDEIEVYTNTPINPGHADLHYINPATLIGEEPNTAIRRFSRVLAKYSKYVLLNELEFESDSVLPVDFKKIINQ